MTQNKVPPLFIKESNTFRIEHDAFCFECTAADSGRITRFSSSGKNVLTGAAVNPFNFGSTFWCSPQSVWEWPPPEEIDSPTIWESRIENSVITLTGPKCPKLGIQIIKRYSADVNTNHILVEYEIKNISDAPVKLGHWEISRVPPGGITFFPTGDVSFPPTYQSPLPTSDIEGITWFHHTPQTVTGEHKLFSDGKEGWIAHLHENLLFIKQFEDTTPDVAAPTEAEIEIYAISSYVEVEQQGAYLPIAPRTSAVWPVRWYLVEVPADTDMTAGSPALTALVRKTIGL